jgi:hypothetical protein
LIKVREIYELLAKKLLQSSFEKNGSFAYEWFKAHMLCNLQLIYEMSNLDMHFFNKTLVSTNCCNIVVLFSTIIEKCSKTFNLLPLVL